MALCKSLRSKQDVNCTHWLRLLFVSLYIHQLTEFGSLLLFIIRCIINDGIDRVGCPRDGGSEDLQVEEDWTWVAGGARLDANRSACHDVLQARDGRVQVVGPAGPGRESHTTGAALLASLSFSAYFCLLYCTPCFVCLLICITSASNNNV